MSVRSNSMESALSSQSFAENFEFNALIEPIPVLVPKYIMMQTADRLINPIAQLILIHLINYYMGYSTTSVVCAAYPIINFLSKAYSEIVINSMRPYILGHVNKKQITAANVYVAYMWLFFIIMYLIVCIPTGVLASKILSDQTTNTAVIAFYQTYIFGSIFSHGLQTLIQESLSIEKNIVDGAKFSLLKNSLQLLCTYMFFLIFSEKHVTTMPEKTVLITIAVIDVLSSFVSQIFPLSSYISKKSGNTLRIQPSRLFPIRSQIIWQFIKQLPIHTWPAIYLHLMNTLTVVVLHNWTFSSSEFTDISCIVFYVILLFIDLCQATNSAASEVLGYVIDTNVKATKYERVYKILTVGLVEVFAISVLNSVLVYLTQSVYVDLALNFSTQATIYQYAEAAKKLKLVPIISLLGTGRAFLEALQVSSKKKYITILITNIDYAYGITVFLMSFLRHKKVDFNEIIIYAHILRGCVGYIFLIPQINKHKKILLNMALDNGEGEEGERNHDHIELLPMEPMKPMDEDSSQTNKVISSNVIASSKSKSKEINAENSNVFSYKKSESVEK
ncbi:Conserved_hypothetical protein [Hexamita inflata]|uniref:DinF protein n=1 Tax=Hexamita inflata TaxID=28002 RepID=A0AA86N3V8_9EUKA|nr:Conserved hypothetical protein [Hexamita inflata]CAI9964247.1 Conserved hypothetical protein [Hexamita inflata]